VTAFGASAKMKPPPAQSRTFDATGSAWFGRWVDTIPLGLHRPLFDFRLLQLPSSTGGPKERYSIALISTGFGRDCRTSRCAALPRLGRPPRRTVLRDSRRRSVRGHHRIFSCVAHLDMVFLRSPEYVGSSPSILRKTEQARPPGHQPEPFATLLPWCDQAKSSALYRLRP
jgi:hypothetical protein